MKGKGAKYYKRRSTHLVFIAAGEQAVHRGTMGNMVDHGNQERLDLRLWREESTEDF